MITLHIGPQRNLPSWDWVGADTSLELKKYFKVNVFKDYKEIKQSDVVLIIKQLPNEKFIESIKQKSKVIYCPIDYFDSVSQIQTASLILKKMDLIISHSENLIPLFEKYAKTKYVDHHLKYALPDIAPFKKTGYVLYVGGFQYTPYILKWIKENPLPIPLKILSDANNQNAVIRANLIAKEIGFQFNTKNVEIHEWSESLQTKMLLEAKAAIDIKGLGFNQSHKPPTKSQKYICSGIPLAMNESESVNYFKNKGFQIVHPTDTNRWLSKDYWQYTATFATKLRPQLTIESIGINFKNYIEELF